MYIFEQIMNSKMSDVKKACRIFLAVPPHSPRGASQRGTVPAVSRVYAPSHPLPYLRPPRHSAPRKDRLTALRPTECTES